MPTMKITTNDKVTEYSIKTIPPSRHLLAEPNSSYSVFIFELEGGGTLFIGRDILAASIVEFLPDKETISGDRQRSGSARTFEKDYKG